MKDDIENTDANGLKRFPEINSSHGIPSKRIRDIFAADADTVSIIELVNITQLTTAATAVIIVIITRSSATTEIVHSA